MPISRADLMSECAGTLAAAAFGQDLPVLAQSIVDIVIAAKASIRTQNGPLFLLWAETQELRQSLQDRNVGGAAVLLTGIEAGEQRFVILGRMHPGQLATIAVFLPLILPLALS